jgi:transcriptional regulator with XRE-family HTH domain
MEFNEKLQELRKRRGITQEELANALFVSRTAVSKWESGRGYPNIDSLKAIAKYFSVTIDELLSSDEVLCIAEEDHKQKEQHFRSLIFSVLDLSIAAFLFLPEGETTISAFLPSFATYVPRFAISPAPCTYLPGAIITFPIKKPPIISYKILKYFKQSLT